MPDSPELAAQRLLDMLPDGCELETTAMETPKGWEATACVHHVSDSPMPNYLGRGPTEEAALLRAIHLCAHYWARRERPRANVISGWRVG